MSDTRTTTRIVEDGSRISKEGAIQLVKDAATDALKDLPTSDYIEACGELSRYFIDRLNADDSDAG